MPFLRHAPPIRFAAPGLHPGGFTWSEALGAFLVCSQRQGKLVLVEKDGRCVDLLDHADLVTSMAVRERDGKAYVAVGHRGSGGRSVSPKKSPGDDTILRIGRLCVFDIASRRHLRTHELSRIVAGPHLVLPDDLAVGGDGTVWLTDACRPVVYRVPPPGRAGPHLFLADDRLGGNDGSSGRIGGITLVEDRFLLLSSAGDGTLFKAPLENPHEFRPVGIPHPFPGADAIEFGADGFLYLAADAPGGAAGAVWRLAPDEHFESVRVAAVDTRAAVGRPSGLAFASHRAWSIDGRVAEEQLRGVDSGDWSIVPFEAG